MQWIILVTEVLLVYNAPTVKLPNIDPQQDW